MAEEKKEHGDSPMMVDAPKWDFRLFTAEDPGTRRPAQDGPVNIAPTPFHMEEVQKASDEMRTFLADYLKKRDLDLAKSRRDLMAEGWAGVDRSEDTKQDLKAVTLWSYPLTAQNILDHLKVIKATKAEAPKMLSLPTDDTLLKRAEARAETLREALVRIQCLASEGPDVLTWTEVIQQIREAASAALQTTKYESGVFRITPIRRELLRRVGWREDQQDPIAFLLKDRGLQWSEITEDEPADGDIRENLIVAARGSTFLGELTGRSKSIDPALTWQEQDVWFVDNNCYDDEPPTHFLKLPPVIEEE